MVGPASPNASQGVGAYLILGGNPKELSCVIVIVRPSVNMGVPKAGNVGWKSFLRALQVLPKWRYDEKK